MNSSTIQIYGCARSDVLTTLDRKSIAPEKWRVLRSLQQLDTRYNWMIVLFLVLWFAAGWMVMNTEMFLLRLLGYFLMACCVNGLPIMMHEGTHSLLTKNPTVTRWLGFFCGLPGLVSYSAYRSIHLVHHGHTRSKDDPDDIEKSARRFIPLVLVYYVVLLVGIYVYILTVAVVGFQKANAQHRRDIVVEYGLMAVIIAAVFWLVPFATLLHCWLIPLLIAGQLSNVRGLAEHGMTTRGNEFTDTRTVISNPFVRFMMCNLNYHLEHHLFPGIPWYYLPKVHQLLQEEYRRAGSSVYASYSEFLKEFFRITWRGVIPNVRLIPQHLREEICL
jgi:fatty acid desaturase